MPIRLRSARMFNAVAIVSALHLLSEVAEGTGQPYGINRQVVAGAARVGQSMGDLRPPPALDPHPAPALSQVAATSGPPLDTTTHLSLDISVSGAAPTDTALSDDQVAASLPACDNGRGVVRYERLPDTVVDGNPIQEDVVRLKTPSSASVLAQCVGRCLQDETALGFISRCTMFDYYPGRKINTYSTADNRFTETKCRLSRPPNQYAKINYRDDPVSIHFREVCYAASVVKAECPSRLYVMERLRDNKFEASDLLEVSARTIEECEDKCLNQYSEDAVNTDRTCRSGYFDKKKNTCYHSGFTRRTHPKLLKADDDYDYFENTCLTKDRRCPRNKLFFMKSADTELFGAYDKEYHQDLTLYECADKCLDSLNIFCRSFVYDPLGRKCMLSGEDRISKPKLVRNSTSSQKSEYYELFCMDGDKVRGNYVFDDSDTQQLNNRRHRDVPTAFQMIRNTRLDLGSGFRRFKDIPGRLTLPECLDACLEETAFVCRSVMHSDKFDACRLSKYDKLNGQTVYDPDFTYYENLMENLVADRQLAAGSADLAVTEGRGQNGTEATSTTQREDEARDEDAGRGSTGANNNNNNNRFLEDDRAGNDRFFTGRGSAGVGGVGTGGGDRDRDRFGAGRVNDRFGSDNGFGLDRDRGGNDTPFGRGSDRGSDRAFDRGSDRGSDRAFDRGSDRGSDRAFDRGSDRGSDPIGFDRGGSGGSFGTGFNENNRFSPLRPSTPLEDRPGRFRPVSSDRDISGDRTGVSRTFGRQGIGATGILGAAGDLFPAGEGNRITGTNQGVTGGRNPLSPFPGGGVEAGGFTGGFGGGSLGVGGGGVGLGGGLGGFVGGNGLGHGGFGIGASRCSDSTNFEPVGTRLRLRSPYIRDFETVDSLGECKRKCLSMRVYTCRSFNFRYDTVRDNCELSDESTHTILRLNNPSHFETDGSADYYERGGGSGTACLDDDWVTIKTCQLQGDCSDICTRLTKLSDKDSSTLSVTNPDHYDANSLYEYFERTGDADNCLDVSQQCYEDGMEFSLRTDEPFRGRIYTYGYYDRCYTRGSGGLTTVLKISGARGVPDCGTIRYGDTTTNIVVVQFSDNVQTAMDKRYNLTCTVVGPDEAVVTSAYIGAGSGAPTPIEYLPAENQLQSQVKLQIMYNGRPTTTIAVGDKLTFRLESLRGYNLVSDIFATDVVAKDPFSGRQVELIDSRGCPLDNYVFPALGKARDGDGLEAVFDAFKIPESNYLIFEATVRTCRRGCQPALCSLGSGRAEEQSYGRRRRDAEDPKAVEGEDDDEEEEGQIHGIYEVLLSRDEFGEEEAAMAFLDEVCVAPAEYYTLVIALAVTVICLVGSLLLSFFCFRRGRKLDEKNASADEGNPYQTPPSKFSFPGSHARTLTQPASYFPSGPTASAPQGEDGAATSSRYPDPSEPIYTDPALFERSRSESSPQRRFGDGQE